MKTFDLDEFEVEGGDAADDMMDNDGIWMSQTATQWTWIWVTIDMGDEEEIEDRVDDLEVALDDLKAEFEKMMSDDEWTAKKVTTI